MFPAAVIAALNKASPWLSELLVGPVSGVVGDLVSTALGGVNMHDPESVTESLKVPGNVERLKELELQLKDLQDARAVAGKESGSIKWVRPFLALLAMVALVGDIYAIQYVTDKMLNEILIMMLVFLVWDIRQIYRFYFGSSDDPPNIGFKRLSK